MVTERSASTARPPAVADNRVQRYGLCRAHGEPACRAARYMLLLGPKQHTGCNGHLHSITISVECPASSPALRTVWMSPASEQGERHRQVASARAAPWTMNHSVSSHKNHNFSNHTSTVTQLQQVAGAAAEAPLNGHMQQHRLQTHRCPRPVPSPGGCAAGQGLTKAFTWFKRSTR